jgi:hypothetical protein
MKAVTLKELKRELEECSTSELASLCLQLTKFKKENKELLTYLLFDSKNEAGYIEKIKQDVDEQFEQINCNSSFYIKKSVRKILRLLKTAIRYSKNKETEVELLLYICVKLSEFKPAIHKMPVILNIFRREIQGVRKKVMALHEDLQYDYSIVLDALTEKYNDY